MALEPCDRPGASRRSTPPAVPPRLPEGCAQEQLHDSRSRRHCQPRLHRRQNQSPDQRQITEPVLPGSAQEKRAPTIRCSVHSYERRAPRCRELQKFPSGAPKTNRAASEHIPRSHAALVSEVHFVNRPVCMCLRRGSRLDLGSRTTTWLAGSTLNTRP